MENSWRASMAYDSRQKIVKRIMETLQRNMPVTGQDGVEELLKIAWRFEEKVFEAATDQQDYLRRISLKMLSLETKANGNSLQGRHPPGAPSVPQPGMNQVDPGPLFDTLCSECKQVLQPLPDLVGDHFEYEVERILKSRNTKKRGKEYLVKWLGYDEKEATWVGANDMANAKEVVDQFEQNRQSNKNQHGS